MSEPMIDVTAVQQLLAESRSAHASYRTAANPPTGANAVPVRPPNYPTAEAHVARALALRLQAHELDPRHTAAAWRDDKAPDAELIKFYVAYSKPLIPETQMAMILDRFPAYAEIAYIP